MEKANELVPIRSASHSEGTPEPNWPMRRKLKLALCLMTGVLLLFCDWTDYSLPGTWADVALPLASVAVGATTLRLSRSIPTTAPRIGVKLAAVITLVEASATVAAVTLLTIISPLGIMILVTSALAEEQTGAVVSPDGMRIAEVFYRGGGLLTDGVGYVRVKYRFIPLLERDVYRGEQISPEHVMWQDNDTLSLPENGGTTKLGIIRPETPPSIQIGTATWQLFDLLWGPSSFVAEMHRRDAEMSRPLQDIPLFPGGIENDNSGANIGEESGYRAFDIKTPSSDNAAKWYEVALSQEPWTVVTTKRRETTGLTLASESEERLVYNCIEAVRRETNGTNRQFYWRFLGREHGRTVRVIVETPEPPAWSECDDP